MEENLYDMQEISSYREGNRLEAKKAKGGIPNSMWETYSSFANTDGGIILLGVDEKKDGSFEVGGSECRPDAEGFLEYGKQPPESQCQSFS